MQTTKDIKETLEATKNLMDVGVALLKAKPAVLPSLRMSTCPPLAVDRLIGLAGISANLVKAMEKNNRIPPRMPRRKLDSDLAKIGKIIEKMADPDVFVWLEREDDPSRQELYRAATIVADRFCGAVANPIIRNAQERRQLVAISEWLTALGYESLPVSEGARHDELQPGTYSFRLNVPVEQKGVVQPINISVDALMLMYLMLYPKGAMKCLLQERPGLKRRVWKFLNQICPQTTLGEGRVYGGGLHKLEPKELGNVPAHTIAELLPRSAWPPRMQQAELFGDR